jgi:hypothetical protein
MKNLKRMLAKNSIYLTLPLLLIGMIRLAMAQTMIPTTSMPTSTIPMAGGAAGGPPSKVEINARITDQETRIDADSKVGKLTVEQVKPLKCSLKKIKKQKKADYVENGKKELGSDQKTDLNNQLDTNEKNLTTTNGVKNTN